MTSLRRLFKGIYKRCECSPECICLIPFLNKMYKPAKIKSGHFYHGVKNPAWKGGKTVDDDGYELTRSVNHPFVNGSGYVRTHRLVYEEYYKCSLLPITVIHHINGDRLDNNIKNIKPLYPFQHC